VGSVYGVDAGIIPIWSIMDKFKASSCRSLKDKPKLFFIQACQGKKKEIFTDGEAMDEDEYEVETDGDPVDPGLIIPSEPHFLLGYSTAPGYVSFRSKSQGSFYISFFVEVLNAYASRLDLLTMLTLVNDKVSQKRVPHNPPTPQRRVPNNPQVPDIIYYQTPAPIHTLTRQFYFYKDPR